MKRREFIKLIAGSAAVWPLAAHAQKPALPVIGFLSAEWPDLFADRLRGFHAGLGQAGYVERQNVSGIAGRRAELINCLPWRPIWFAVR
jgi:putative tryptophan/tyrosine transport system substrate-binding protein